MIIYNLDSEKLLTLKYKQSSFLLLKNVWIPRLLKFSKVFLLIVTAFSACIGKIFDILYFVNGQFFNQNGNYFWNSYLFVLVTGPFI